MPLNWMSLVPGLHPRNVEVIRSRARERSTAFADVILSGSRCFPWSSFIHLLWGLVLLPASLAYMLVGRFFLSKLFFANFHCNGCGLCVDNCSHHALRMRGKEPGRPYWTFTCESCMRCLAYCPRKAVEAGHSIAVVFCYLATVPMSTYLLNWLDDSVPWLAGLHGTFAEHVLLQYPYFLFSIYLTYRLLSVLIRVPAINRFFTYTTLTHIYRRYRDPETKLKNMDAVVLRRK